MTKAMNNKAKVKSQMIHNKVRNQKVQPLQKQKK